MTPAQVELLPSSFGGGWAIPLNDTGLAYLREFFGEEPHPLLPLGGQDGYIVEPHDWVPLIRDLEPKP